MSERVEKVVAGTTAIRKIGNHCPCTSRRLEEPKSHGVVIQLLRAHA